MSALIRFGVSLEKQLLAEFDKLIKAKGYSSRSEALRDLLRQELVTRQWQEGREIAGAITLIFDHHRRELVNKLTDIQHDFQDIIISNQHIHLDHDNCLEIIALMGSAGQAQRLANILKAVKGVKHATLSMSTTGKSIS